MAARIIKINLDKSEKKIFSKFIINDLKKKISDKDIIFQNKNGHFISNLYAIDLELLSNVITDLEKNYSILKKNNILNKFELENIKNIKAKFLSGGQKKKLVISLSLLSNPKVLLLDECFAALDVLTIKMLQEIIVNLQQESQITICICDHQARDLLACVDIAMILSNCKVIAQDTPSNLVKDINAQNAYFGNSFKFN